MNFLAIILSTLLLSPVSGVPASASGVTASPSLEFPEAAGLMPLENNQDNLLFYEVSYAHEARGITAESFYIPPVSPERNDPTLAVSTQGQIQLPADRIRFNINLNAVDESPQQAYELHKQREEVLVELLREFDFSEEDINYEPISISKTNRHPQREQDPQYQTSQQVRLMIRDFSVYEKMQVRLIESGYDSFSGSFMSSKADEGKDRAIREAIRKAKEKAQVIAEEAGLTLGTIKNINYHEAPDTPQYARASMDMAREGKLMEFDQTVTVTASVSINFKIQDS